MKPISLSINPTYFCNFRCDFCYLTKEQLGDQKKIDLDVLDKRLEEVSKKREIAHVDLYGGEIGALKKDYYYELKKIIKKYYQGKININTNYSMLDDRFFEDDITLSVSYDFEAREKNELVYKNMLLSEKPLSVLILASPKVIEKDVEEMIKLMNMCVNVESVEIKPYSTNQANQHNVTHKDFEDFVWKWLNSKTEKYFQFVNHSKIVKSLSNEYNAFSNDHVYITPNGKFAVLEFDKDDKEFFLEVDSFEKYENWAMMEPYKLSPICRMCKYFGSCLTEHYRYVKDLSNSCNGYKGLLDRFNSYERMED